MSTPGDFYRAFEDRHRGSREQVQERHKAYVPYLRAVVEAGVPQRLVDVGCGRGEWLELAASQGWQAQGVDQDAGMLEACRGRGLDVTEGDLLSAMRGLDDASLGAVTALHVVEHLPFEALLAFLREALRALAPGGLLVMETPNPENLVVGSNAFYMDPTHVRPLPPALLSFVAEYSGFAQTATLRLHEGLPADAPVSLIDVLAGVSPDYAIVARKPGGAASPALDALLARRVGFNLNDMADRYDAKLRELERRVAVAEALKDHAVARIFKDQHRVIQAEELVQKMQASTSWRVTAPLRSLGSHIAEGKRHGARAFVRSILQRVRSAMRPAVVEVQAPPPPSPPPAAPPPSPSPEAAPTPPSPAVPMTATARRVYEEMLESRRAGAHKEA